MKAKLLLPYRRLVLGAAIAASVGLVLAACGAPAVAAGLTSASPTHAGHMAGMTTNAKPVPGVGVPVASSSVQIINLGLSPAVRAGESDEGLLNRVVGGGLHDARAGRSADGTHLAGRS